MKGNHQNQNFFSAVGTASCLLFTWCLLFFTVVVDSSETIGTVLPPAHISIIARTCDYPFLGLRAGSFGHQGSRGDEATGAEGDDVEIGRAHV